MNPTQTRWTPLPPLEIDWQNGVPVARQSGDVFFSTEDGVAESDYVFIQGNQLRERWAAHTCDQPFVIAEVGLGTGLNTCLTIAEWLKHRPIGATLHYLGFEKAPVRPDDMRRALSHWPELEPIITTTAGTLARPTAWLPKAALSTVGADARPLVGRCRGCS